MAVTPARKQAVLFVDDEQDLLDGLRDALRRYRGVWSMRFVNSGDAALAQLAAEPADVVVSDIQMPGMNGAALFAQVQERHPSTIRIVLSGYADADVVARAATVAHRIMAKPCNADELADVLKRSLALHSLTERAELYRASIAATTLPSRPGLYMEIANLIADPAAGADDIARVIERDPAMTAKVLQLANSAFFGVGRTVTRVRDAVVNLGGDTVKSLSLSAEAFGKLAPRDGDGFSFERFEHHSTLVARIASSLICDKAAAHDAATAALLHDIGKLVAINDDRRRWLSLTDEARSRNLAVHELEREQLGVTHAATGAYLLSLWGLPLPVIEAVAHHHDPSTANDQELSPAAAVHIADALAHEAMPTVDGEPPAPTLDEEFVSGLRPQADLALWRELAHEAAAIWL